MPFKDLNKLKLLSVQHDKESFLIDMVSTLSETLEQIVGYDEAAGFISVVGSQLGDHIHNEYKKSGNIYTKLDLESVANVLVDLKARIGGEFSIESITPEKIVLTNTKCPFGRSVIGKPALCMMTSNVFGRVVADNTGYARIELDKTIANGNKGCRVIVHLNYETRTKTNSREYFERPALNESGNR